MLYFSKYGKVSKADFLQPLEKHKLIISPEGQGQIWGSGGISVGLGQRYIVSLSKAHVAIYKTTFLWEFALLQETSLASVGLCESSWMKDFF